MYKSQTGKLFKDQSLIGDYAFQRDEDEKFNEALRHGRIVAQTLQKPMTFYEAVEALRLPRLEDNSEGKKKDNKKKELKWEPHHLLTKIDLSGFKFLRFSRAGLQELAFGIDKMPCIKSVSLKNNGIGDEHDKEILALMSI